MNRPCRLMPAIAAAGALVVIGALLVSCAHKSFPRPIQPQPPPGISSLTVAVSNGKVDLHWTLSRDLGKFARPPRVEFSIGRIVLDADRCRNCPPPTPARIALLDPYSMRNEKKGELKSFRWTDSSVDLGKTYLYQVFLVDGKERILSRSNRVSAPVVAGPAAPRRVEATGMPTGVIIQWLPPKLGRQPKKASLRYLIERMDPDNQWRTVNEIPIQGTRFVDNTVSDGKAYTYRVTSLIKTDGVSIRGNSALSPVVTVHKLSAPPPPQTVWIIPHQGKLQVYWSTGEGKTGGYNVYRKYKGEIIRLTAQPVPAPPFIDVGAKPNAVYSYAVSAVSSGTPPKEGLLSKWIEFRNVVFRDK